MSTCRKPDFQDGDYVGSCTLEQDHAGLCFREDRDHGGVFPRYFAGSDAPMAMGSAEHTAMPTGARAMASAIMQHYGRPITREEVRHAYRLGLYTRDFRPSAVAKAYVRIGDIDETRDYLTEARKTTLTAYASLKRNLRKQLQEVERAEREALSKVIYE